MTYDIDSIAPFICLKCVGGSKAYGLETPASDDDVKGVFLAPAADVLCGRAPATVQDAKHDVQYTELGEFCRQLELNNSGALELWACMGQEQELYCAPWLRAFMQHLHPLSRRCCHTYTANARAQLKRIAATHGKAVRQEPPPARLCDCCFVLCGAERRPLATWCAEQGVTPLQLAAAPVEGVAGLYTLHRRESRYGLFGKDGTAIATPALSPQDAVLGYLFADTALYRARSRAVAQYREWQAERNCARLQTAADLPPEEGLYDTKHLAHVFRLLHTAREIAEEGCIHVRRTHDNAFLRTVRRGELPLSALLQQAEEEIAALPPLFERSALPEKPDMGDWPRALAELRLNLTPNHPA